MRASLAPRSRRRRQAAQARPPRPASLDTILKQVVDLRRRDRVRRDLEAARLRLRAQGRPGRAGRVRGEAPAVPEDAGARPSAKDGRHRYLRVIAGDTAVPALQAMLADDRSADLALYVLQQIPGPAAEDALVQALKTTRGDARSRSSPRSASGARRGRGAGAGAAAAAARLSRGGGDGARADRRRRRPRPRWPRRSPARRRTVQARHRRPRCSLRRRACWREEPGGGARPLPDGVVRPLAARARCAGPRSWAGSPRPATAQPASC